MAHLRELTVNTNHIDLAMVLHCRSGKAGKFKYYAFILFFGSRKWQPTPVSSPGESHGQRSLAGYSPWGLKESDMTERLSTACSKRGRPMMVLPAEHNGEKLSGEEA